MVAFAKLVAFSYVSIITMYNNVKVNATSL
jgi:hypothetical protein